MKKAIVLCLLLGGCSTLDVPVPIPQQDGTVQVIPIKSRNFLWHRQIPYLTVEVAADGSKAVHLEGYNSEPSAEEVAAALSLLSKVAGAP